MQSAYKILLLEHYPERAENFHLSKQKVVENRELVKAEALKNIQDGKAAGGAYNGYVRSCELLGKAVGLFNTVHHKHEHELAAVSTEALLDDIRARIRLWQPCLPNSLAKPSTVSMKWSRIPTSRTTTNRNHL